MKIGTTCCEKETPDCAAVTSMVNAVVCGEGDVASDTMIALPLVPIPKIRWLGPDGILYGGCPPLIETFLFCPCENERVVVESVNGP